MREKSKLENIGFYTLSDSRAEYADNYSPLWRCELILTDACNFKCQYCRGIAKEYSGSLSWDYASMVLSGWLEHDLRNIRFSGGEPTLWKDLSRIVRLCKYSNVKHIAISTNGSMHQEIYDELLESGVNDFSISLDACCSSTSDTMSGTKGTYERILANIEYLSSKTYVTVGVVLTNNNIGELADTVKLAHSLGVADIRLISAAQWNRVLHGINLIPENIRTAHPILKYRTGNILSGRNVRGLAKQDTHKCPLVLDDMAIVGNYHFPCIIYLREQGKPIGEVINMDEVRQDRLNWYLSHNTHDDPICQGNCLDVCVDYNNKYEEYHDSKDARVAV